MLSHLKQCRNNVATLCCAKNRRSFKGDVTRDDLQRRFLVQHSIAMLEQCWSHLKQRRNNVAALCCAKNRRCESSRLTSPSKVMLHETICNDDF